MYGSRREGERVFLVVYLDDRYYTASKQFFYKKNGFPYPDPS
jgi:hypothetical protein